MTDNESSSCIESDSSEYSDDNSGTCSDGSKFTSKSGATTHLRLYVGSRLMYGFFNSIWPSYEREAVLAPPSPLHRASTTDTQYVKRTIPNGILDHSSVNRLFQEMPLVNKLEVLCAVQNIGTQLDDALVDSLLPLLQQWAKSLVTLRLWFQYEPVKLANLVAAINQLSVLNNLTLEVEQYSVPKQTNDVSEASSPCNSNSSLLIKSQTFLDSLLVSSQLEEFYLFYPSLSEPLVQSLANQTRNATDKLRRVGLSTYEGINESLLNMMQRVAGQSQLTRTLVQMPQLDRPLGQTVITNFFMQFRALNSLQIDCAQLSLVNLANCLSPLKSLIYLRLLNAFTKLENPLSADDNVASSTISSLDSVLRLTVDLYPDSHEVLNSVHWGRVFPKVTQVALNNRNKNCLLCNPASLTGLGKKTSNDDFMQCCRLMMQPLKQCTKLQKTSPVDIIGADNSTAIHGQTVAK